MESDEVFKKVRDIIDEKLALPRDDEWLCYDKDWKLDLDGIKEKHDEWVIDKTKQQ